MTTIPASFAPDQKPYGADPYTILYADCKWCEPDEDKVVRWSIQVDSLLVYAGLFSAVVVGCIIGLKHGIVTSSPRENDCSLWLASLVTALFTAFAATLVKQWLLDLSERHLDSTVHMRFVLRRRRYNNLMRRSRIPLIVTLLPVLLRFASILFLAGLVTELRTSRQALTSIAASLIGVWVITYAIVYFAPINCTGRAYKCPESLLAVNIYYAVCHFVCPHTLPFAFSGLCWRSWEEIELADVGVRRVEGQTREEQDMEALAYCCTASKLSERRFAQALWEASVGFTPGQAMTLVNSIANTVSSRRSSTLPTPDWKFIWTPRVTLEADYEHIAPHGINALLDIAVDRVLRPAGGVDSQALDGTISDETMAALACISTLIPYRRDDFDRLNVRLADPLASVIRTVWGPSSRVDAKAKHSTAAVIFQTLCFAPELCEQRALCPLPREFAMYILKKTTWRESQISKFILTPQVSEPVGLYVALKLAALSVLPFEAETDRISARLCSLIISMGDGLYEYMSNEEDDKDKIIAAMFRILCFVPDLCAQGSLSSLPREFVMHILDKATYRNDSNEISNFILESQRSAAASVGFYVVLKLVELAGVEIGGKPTAFVGSWLAVLGSSAQQISLPQEPLRGNTLERMQALKMSWRFQGEGKLLDELCDLL